MTSAGWLDLKRKLIEQQERDFERAAARVLRFKYPAILQTPARKILDQAGIDLVARQERLKIQVAVQCKGWGVQELGPAQLTQSLQSLDSFHASRFSAETFIFLHNREGRNREFAKAVQKKLDELVAAGKCKTADLWDVDTFLNQAEAAIRQRLDASIHEGAKNKLAASRRLFEVIGAPLTEVPAAEKLLYLTAGAPVRVDVVAEMQTRGVGELLTSRASEKFTLLVGNFGTGKTTAGLLAASGDAKSSATVLFAECAYFPTRRLGSGLSPLLEELLKSSDAFSDLPFRNQELLHLATPAIRSTLSGGGGQAARFVLLLDGLDENRLYATPDGMMILINSLADIACPIILTTRREHLISTLEAFERGALAMEGRGANKKPIRVFELGDWTRTEIIKFVEGAAHGLLKEGKGTEAGRLSQFLEILKENLDEQFYGQLAAHPLFLRLILDDIVRNGVRKIGRASLLRDWSYYKVHRDLIKRCQTTEQGWTFGPGYVERVMVLMEDVAAQMTVELNGCLVLREFLPDSDIEEIASVHFPEDTDALVTVLLNSLLVPRSAIANKRYSVHFAYRAFHEFFLACDLVRKGVRTPAPDTQVDEFVSELVAAGFGKSDGWLDPIAL